MGHLYKMKYDRKRRVYVKYQLKIKTKLLVPVLIMNVIFSIIIGSAAYQRIQKRYVELIGKEASAILTLLRESIDGDKVSALRDVTERKTLYREMYDEIAVFIEHTDAKYVYLIGEVDGVYQYLLKNYDATGQLEVLEEGYQGEVLAALNGKTYTAPYIDKADKENLVTAYIPVYDKAGTIVAVLGADYDATTICNYLNKLLIYITLFGILQTVAATCIMNYIVSRMKKQIMQVDNKLQELVSSNGDLTKKIEVQIEDEIGDIAKKINELLSYIHTVISNISNVTIHMNESIQETRKSIGTSVNELEEIASSTEELNAMTEETYSNIENISSVIEAMKLLLENVDAAIKNKQLDAKENCQKANTICKKAMEEKEEVNKITAQLNDSVEKKIRKANELKKISNLTEQILRVAKKTSLLALNASIEAARAGEAGKGFSVVAEQISELSEDTAKTATEIQLISQKIIYAVGELSGEASNVIQFIDQKTLNSYDKLLAIGEEYAKNSEEMQVFFDHVSMQSNEIQRGMEEIVEAIHAITEASRECASGIGEVTKLTANLTENLSENEQQAEQNEDLMKQMELEVQKFVI